MFRGLQTLTQMDAEQSKFTWVSLKELRFELKTSGDPYMNVSVSHITLFGELAPGEDYSSAELCFLGKG